MPKLNAPMRATRNAFSAREFFNVCEDTRATFVYSIYIDIYIRKNFSQCQRGEREREEGGGGEEAAERGGELG